MAFTQPLPVAVYKAMKWANPVCTYHCPLHLHCSWIYIPGMAGDRKMIPHSPEGYDNLAQQLKDAPDDFIVNDGSDLLCEAPIPDFWHETLRILEKRLKLTASESEQAQGQDQSLQFKLSGLKYFHKDLDGKISTKIDALNSVKYAAGSKSKYFLQEQTDRLKLLSTKKSNPNKIRG